MASPPQGRISSRRIDGGPSRKSRRDDVQAGEILERRPPYNSQAEMSVLGSILLKPDICDEIIPILKRMQLRK